MFGEARVTHLLVVDTLWADINLYHFSHTYGIFCCINFGSSNIIAWLKLFS